MALSFIKSFKLLRLLLKNLRLSMSDIIGIYFVCTRTFLVVGGVDEMTLKKNGSMVRGSGF